MRRRDSLSLAALALLPLLLHARTLGTGRTYFLNDLTNISYPWRAMTAEQLQRGQVPLWDPWAYFGLPLLGNFQTGLFHPLSVGFHIFHFPAFLGFFLVAVEALAGLGAYCWLRSRRASPGAALAGAAIFSIGGYMIGHSQFTNLVAAYAHLPLLFLLAGSLPWMAATSALAFLAGYPPLWAGMTGALLLLGPGLRGWGSRRALGTAAAGSLFALALAGAALLPGAELTLRSARAAGIEETERLRSSLRPVELASLIHPALAGRLDRVGKEAHPQMERIVWTHDDTATTFTFPGDGRIDEFKDPAGIRYVPWKSAYMGCVGALLALAGLVVLALRAPASAACLAAYAGSVALLMLGGNSRASAWLWLHAPGLALIRGPARLSYLLAPLAPALAAAGLDSLARARRLVGARLAAAAAAAVLVELLATGWGFYPTIAADYFHEPGELVAFLRGALGGLRYYQYPSGDLWPLVDKDDPSEAYRLYKESAYRGYKQKLFGVVQGTYHLGAATGGFEPLVPAGSDRVIGAFDPKDPRRRGEMEARLRWAGIRFALDRKPVPGTSLADRGTRLWRVYEQPRAESRAYLFAPDREPDLAGSFMGLPPGTPATPWAFERPREDRFRASGTAPKAGILFVAEPFYPGWKAYAAGGPLKLERALDAFIRLRVAPGTTRIDFLYRPASWLAGLWLSLAALAALAWTGARRALAFEAGFQ